MDKNIIKNPSTFSFNLIQFGGIQYQEPIHIESGKDDEENWTKNTNTFDIESKHKMKSQDIKLYPIRDTSEAICVKPDTYREMKDTQRHQRKPTT